MKRRYAFASTNFALLFTAATGCRSDGAGEAACAGASAADAGAPIEERAAIDVAAPTTLVVALSTAEQIQLCNWTAQELGGYGGMIPCLDCSGNPGLAAPVSLEDCVSVLQFGRWGRACPLTVQDYMSCTNWQVENVCKVSVYELPLPEACEVQTGSLCEGAIASDAASGATDNTDASLDGGNTAPSADATSSDATSMTENNDAASAGDITGSDAALLSDATSSAPEGD